MSVAVLIPTFRRNAALTRALESVFCQTRTPDEIIVADNDPDAGAKAMVTALQAHSPCPLIYVHAAEPGVANARNTGFAATSAPLIAQLDDDETASPGWLAALLAQHTALGTAVVFGPVTARAHAPGPVRAALMRRLYSRRGPDVNARLNKPFGCGNSLIDRTAVALPDPVFDPRANERGGEDDILFAQLGAQGAGFGWAVAATVTEHVEDRRARWRHLLARSLAYGQGPSQTAAAAGLSGVPKLAIWMAVGAAQAVLYSLALAPARLVSAEAAAHCLDRVVQGMGKLFWFDAITPRLYGAAQLKAS